ncbi:hypothetical protein [Yoonia sp. BS5-3]|uniref:Uncharacterized protein n=1 Tax=Yoonia phaeophyticola TaxID=3137369 RepID=A0ABZ2V9B3_9RHOB
MPEYSFRQAQSAFDLISLLQAHDDQRLTTIGGSNLIRVIRENGCRFLCDDDQASYEELATLCLDASDDAEIATAVLIANTLQHGLWHEDTKDFADAATVRIHEAPDVLRAAILRGLDTIEDSAFRYEPASYLLPQTSRLTQHVGDVMPALCRLAQRMDSHIQKSVSQADYGYLADQHLEALGEALANEDCQFPKNESWFPREVVELVAHVPSTPGFVECTALLLANALPTNDRMGWFNFRWERLSAEYNGLPESCRNTIFAGFRYLYEADKEFLCFSQRKNWHPIQASEGMIPINPPASQ